MEWIVEVVGESSDLEELSRSLDSAELRLTQEGQSFFLRSMDFNSLKSADDVRNNATEILSLINGAARLALRMRKPLVVGNIVKVNDGGKRRIFASLSATMSLRGNICVSITRADGTVEQFRQADPIPSWIEVAQHDKNVAKVLRLFAGTHDWVNLYRIYEVIEDDIGGKHNIESKGWATKKAITLFKHTANSIDVIGDESRHGKKIGEPPPNPMPLSEAKSLIETILHNWFRSKKDNLDNGFLDN